MAKNPATSNGNCDFLAARLRISPALEVRVVAQPFKEGCFVHIREFALTNENEYVATPRGVVVSADRLGLLLDAVRDMREAGDREGLVATIPAGGGREVRLSITSWQGITKADLRLYFSNANSRELLPTKKGVRLNLALLAELERGLEALDRQLGG